MTFDRQSPALALIPQISDTREGVVDELARNGLALSLGGQELVRAS